MWNASHSYSNEELEVVKELERELFKYNPGFRAMWHDDFEWYFQGTLDEKLWEQRERERNKELEEIVRKRMLEDFEYVKFRHELALIEESVFGGDIFSLKQGDDKWLDRRENWENDKLYKVAKNWGWELSKLVWDQYKDNKNIHLFRIGINCTYVPSKIVFASSDSDFEERIEKLGDLALNMPWTGYTLALTFLIRTLESMIKLKEQGVPGLKLDFDKYLKVGAEIRLELIDRLENMHQLAIKASSRYDSSIGN